ncbi:MAG: class I SAM-dependent methyltransferase [Burkholderiales bacterium]|nr:class I SAM-dependent methyltransferase [Burkholderiales bacterium]
METRLFGRVEQRLRDLGLPLGVTLWNGQSLMPLQAPRLKVTVRSLKALASLVNPSMGKLARHYVEQDLDVEGDARELVRMSEALSETSATEHGTNFHWRRWMRHSRLFDRKAIRYHYDVNDDFFGLWLDKHRVYSCAYYRRADDTLDVAQEQKLDLICRKLQLQPGERFLDIGCGWGALLMWAARHYKVRATGITLSSNQHQYAMRQIREQGLEKLCEVRLMDYRDLPENEPFDKVASVGMFEHVGRKNLPHYFAKIYRVLKPGGLVLNHGITLNSPDQNELGSDIGEFIEDYVFPGGELVHISRVIDDMSSQGLECWDIESLRPHYARTLWHWVGRLEANRDAVLAMVDEKVFRIWHVYMAGSAHGFERGWMSIYQVLAGRPFADGTLAFPLTRDYINET